MYRYLVLGLALFSVAACAGWDDSKALKDLDESEKTALCEFGYDAYGGQPVQAVCTPEEEGRLVPVLIAQGERDEEVEKCVADSRGRRWVDCPTQAYVDCLKAVDSAGDLCASQTADECKALAICVAKATAPEEEEE